MDDLFPDLSKGINGYDTSPERLTRLTEALKIYDEGREALRFMHDNTVSLRFLNPRNPKELDRMGGENASYDPETKTILLNPAAPDDRLLSDIPHETWHAGQGQKGILNALHQLKNPSQVVALHNMVEAAAYTEQAIDGVPLPKDELRVTQADRSLTDLRLLYERATAQHETPEAARLDVFKAALAYETRFESKLTVDIQKLGMSFEDAKSLGDGDPKRQEVTGVAADLAQDKFASLLRSAGDMTLAAGGGNMFTGMSDADIVELATSKMTPANRQALTETQAAYDAVRVSPKPRER